MSRRIFTNVLAYLALALATSLSLVASAGDDTQRQVQAPQVQAPRAVAKSACPSRCNAFRFREQDEIWAVDTRGLGCLGCGSPEVGFHVLQIAAGHWVNSTSAAFYATDDAEIVTLFYIHGNRVDYQQSLRDGLETYFQLVGSWDDERPVRFVIWTWPSDQIHGALKDIRAKAARTNDEGYFLAKFLAEMHGDVRVGLIGYSFGARIVTGSLHLLGGGSLCGRMVADSDAPQIRVALWAAAEHNDSLLPGRFHGAALPMGDRWYITVNCCDPVLARYHMIDKCSDPVALGYAGIWGMNLIDPAIQARIEQANVSNIVGGTHDRQPYLYSPYIAGRTREYTLWHDFAEAAKKEAAVALAE
jgi:hypothetical protein